METPINAIKKRGIDYLNKYSCERSSQSSMGALYYDTQSFSSSLLPQYYNFHRMENNIIAGLSD